MLIYHPILVLAAIIIGYGTNAYVGVGAAIIAVTFMHAIQEWFRQSANNVVRLNNNLISDEKRKFTPIEK